VSLCLSALLQGFIQALNTVQSDISSRSPCWHTRFCTAQHHGTSDHSTVWRICLVGGRSVLPAPAAWWFRRLGCPLSVVGASTSLLLVSGIGCLKTLPWRRHQHSGVVWKLSFFNSHIRMLLYLRHLSGPCGDTGHLGHYRNNWTELNWTSVSRSVWHHDGILWCTATFCVVASYCSHQVKFRSRLLT